MRFLITPNGLRSDALCFAQNLAAQLAAAGHTPLVPADTAALPGWEQAQPWVGGDFDMLMIAGGDGTMLKFIRETGCWDVPVWGVNFGHIGYLTECEPPQAAESLERILAGNYTTEQRILLAGELADREGRVRARFLAVNEANIFRGAMARALQLELAINDSFVRRYAADGVIVSTPTGSTAYSFSAGGPILMPTMDCFAVTPVCPYASLASAIVTSGSDRIRVTVHVPQPEPDAPPLLIIDSYEKYALRDGDEIRLYKAPCTLRTVKTREWNFYAKLQQKLAEN